MTIYDTRHNGGAATGVERAATTITADDGRALTGTWYRPGGGAPIRGRALLVPAMATPAAFYDGFATWLAEAGYATLTFDYRGMGSVPEMRAETGDMVRWARDAASALDHVLASGPSDAPVTWIGHSFGGQALPWARHDLLDRVLLVASGLGTVRHNTPRVRRVAPLMWRVVVPLASRVAGYYPGDRIGVLGNLPAGVARQWGRWCLDDDYFRVDVPDIHARLAEVSVPISTLHFTDDELLGASSMAALEELYVGAPLESTRLSAADLDVERIGHHGFFRAALRPAWERLVLPRLATR